MSVTSRPTDVGIAHKQPIFCIEIYPCETSHPPRQCPALSTDIFAKITELVVRHGLPDDMAADIHMASEQYKAPAQIKEFELD